VFTHCFFLNGGGQVMSHASYILSLSDDILILLDDRCDLS
jgi:hypothetical protein